MHEILFKIGSYVIKQYKFAIGYFQFSWLIIRRAFNVKLLVNPAVFNNIIRQTNFAGVELVGLVTIFSLVIGMLAVGGIGRLLIFLNIKETIGFMLTMVIIRTAAPIIVGLLLTLRSSTAFIIEIGQMKSNNEIKTLEAMDIDLFDYVYLPRVVASMVSMIALSTYFAVVAIVGGYVLISFQLDTTLGSIIGQIIYDIRLVDMLSFGVKTVLIGFMVASIPIYTALKITQESTIDSIKSFKYGMIRIFVAFIAVIVISEVVL